MKIELYQLSQFSHAQRERRVCAECERRRLTTKCRLVAVSEGAYPVEVIEWLCNECLTATPNWPGE